MRPLTFAPESYLHYIHASLADAARRAPNLGDDNVALVSTAELEKGVLSAHAVKRLHALAKRAAGKDVDDDRLWPIRILICPLVYSLRPEHGKASSLLPAKIAPVVLSAKLSQNGALGDDDRIADPVVVPRDLLEPSRREVVIGTVDEADQAYAQVNSKRGEWRALMQRADELVCALTGASLHDLAIERYERLEGACALLMSAPPATFHIQNLVDHMRSDQALARPLPLFKALASASEDHPMLSPDAQLAVCGQHLGQMACRHGLSASQRESLSHFLASAQDAPNVLAIDGPPGTGKTSLLLSVIATLWVERALAGDEPPLIVASSTNNQAVLNILKAFSEVKDDDGPLAGRWLPGMSSYGLYLPAKSKTEIDTDFPVHDMRGMGKDAVYHAKTFETQEGIKQAREAYLTRVKTALDEPGITDLPAAMAALQSRLRAEVAPIGPTLKAIEALTARLDEPLSSGTVERSLRQHEADLALLQNQETRAAEKVKAARRLKHDWFVHVDSEPWWISALAALRLDAKRINRDRVFCSTAEQAYEDLVGCELRQMGGRPALEQAFHQYVEVAEAAHEQARQQTRAMTARLTQLNQTVDVLRRIVPHPGELSAETVQAALDMGPRYRAFKLADHYWEARYLHEVETHLAGAAAMDDSKSPEKFARQYRRLAKLYPCFVTTLYTLPARFTGYLQEPRPLYGLIDLLIVDEAGQVPPEIGAPSFALAKRALVVGDVDQIKPIWSIPLAMDGANALRHGLISSDAMLEAFHASGVAASSGSLMRLAQRATPYVKHAKRGRGLFLCEHRRSWSEIIHMCNVLVYQGLLKPCRQEAPRRMLPSVGYVHLPGMDVKRGSSRENRLEAAAIGKWLAQRRQEIEEAFKDDGKSFGQLVAVVTPFAAQSRAVRTALDDELGKGHGITVGTVHALQGAERRLVIFSPTHGLGTRPGSTFFDRDASMLNVAISRAQDAFLVFGNMHLFQPGTGTHPSAIVGQFLFKGGENELPDVPANLLVPGYDMSPGTLIADLNGHRSALAEAFETARHRLVIVSPFLTSNALLADQILDKVAHAISRGVRISIVTDPELNQDRAQFEHCTSELTRAGASIKIARTQGVHSKMILVDNAWLVVGSFNWLSAVRERKSTWTRYESSLRYDGNEAFQMIGKSLRDISEIVGS